MRYEEIVDFYLIPTKAVTDKKFITTYLVQEHYGLWKS